MAWHMRYWHEVDGQQIDNTLKKVLIQPTANLYTDINSVYLYNIVGHLSTSPINFSHAHYNDSIVMRTVRQLCCVRTKIVRKWLLY